MAIPTNACPYCGGGSYGVVEKVRHEVRTSAKKGLGNVLDVACTMVVCRGCGATAMFTDPEKFLDDVEHGVISVAT